jgi:hypothetical protein
MARRRRIISVGSDPAAPRPPTRQSGAAMTERETIEFITAMPNVAVVTASEENGAPQVAWGDTFFFYAEGPDSDRTMPFATVVQNDYDGFDERSQLRRPGVFRVNVGLGRERFEELLGSPPAAHDRHREEYDYAAFDRLLYAPQGWVSVVNPGKRTGALVRELLAEAHRARPPAPGAHARALTASDESGQGTGSARGHAPLKRNGDRNACATTTRTRFAS